MRTDIIDEARREFYGRLLCRSSKAIFAVALASKFFIDLRTWLRVLMPSIGLFFFIAAFLITQKETLND